MFRRGFSLNYHEIFKQVSTIMRLEKLKTCRVVIIINLESKNNVTATVARAILLIPIKVPSSKFR